MNSILNLSTRTVSKILIRLNIGCFNCGWNESICDIHHIIHRSKGGLNSHDNLTYLCPNCHRLAHKNLLTKFFTFSDKIGDRWMDFYYPEKSGYIPSENITNARRNNLKLARNKLNNTYLEGIPSKLKLLEESNIDFSKYGWCNKAADIIKISPQKVSNWLKLNAPHIYEKCKKRKSRLE